MAQAIRPMPEEMPLELWRGFKPQYRGVAGQRRGDFRRAGIRRRDGFTAARCAPLPTAAWKAIGFFATPGMPSTVRTRP